MAIRKYIPLLAFTILIGVFSYGQSPDLGTVCAESIELYGVNGFDNSEFIWSVDGGIITDGDGEDTVTVNWGYNTGTYIIEVVEVTNWGTGCTGLTQTAQVTIQGPQVDLGYDFYEICVGDSMIFDASGNYDDPYTIQWHDSTFSATYTAKETELIWVLVTDELGCNRYDSVDFVSNPLPFVYLGNDTILCDEQNAMELDAGDFSGYQWSTTNGGFSNGNPFYVFPVKGVVDTITVAVTNNYGCVNTDTIAILPCNVLSLFKNITNSFTPNGDEVNDVWNINYIEQFPNAVLEIFDRWGRLVYHTENIVNEPWDGTSKGREMPMDSYFYVIDLKYMNLETISGTVNLIR